jgi:hypothetical protein
MENGVVSFLENDRKRWLAKRLAAVVGADTRSASLYLLQQVFARLARLRQAGTDDATLRDDFQALRSACDIELIAAARAKGLAGGSVWVPVEEVAPLNSNVPPAGWPVSGRLVSGSFTLPTPTPAAAVV